MNRVCIFTSAHIPFDTRIFHKECKSLAKAGYRVTLIAPYDHDEEKDGIQIKAVPKPKGGRVSRMTRTVWQVYREVLRQNADLFLFHDLELIGVGLLLRVRGKIVIFDIHEDFPASIVSKYYLPRLFQTPTRWLTKVLQKWLYCYFSALLVAEPDVAGQICNFNDIVTLVQNYPSIRDLEVSEENASGHGPKSVAYVGAISRLRGIREMVEAINLLPKDLSVSLILAGEFWPEDLQKEVEALPGWSRVRYLGHIDRHGVKEVLDRSIAGLVVLHPEPNYVCAYPTKMFEYMLASVPVVASDFPLWRQIVDGVGCGILVNPLDPMATAEAIEYLITHPEEAETMGKRGREAVERRYNWESEERKLLQLFDNLLGRESTQKQMIDQSI